MKKRPDWRVALKRVVADMIDRPFEWGKVDGVVFAADAVKAMTGKDVLEGGQGYRSLKTGMRRIKRAGLVKPIDPFALVLKEVPRAKARPGDVVEFESDCVGVCMGPNAFGVSEERGLGLVAMSTVTRVLRVPD